MPYNPCGAFTRLETIGCCSGIAFSDLLVPSMSYQAGKRRNACVIIKRTGVSSWTSLAFAVIFFVYDLRLGGSIGCRDACHVRRSSSDEVSYFATFGTYIIRRDDIGS